MDHEFSLYIADGRAEHVSGYDGGDASGRSGENDVASARVTERRPRGKLGTDRHVVKGCVLSHGG